MRPLSDPGAAARVAPFAYVGIIAAVLLLLAAKSSGRSGLAVGAVMAVILIAAALLLPWARLPDWCQAAPALIALGVIALVRHAEGGATSGYSALVVLPVLWLAIFGTRTQLRVAVAATAALFFGPLLLVGPPMYPASGWRESVIWVAIVLLVGTSTQTLVDSSRRRAADVAALGALTHALAAGSDPRPELCAAAQDVTDAAFVVLFEPHADGSLVATAATDGVDRDLMRIDPRTEVSATAEVWRTGTRIYLADAVADPRGSTRLVKLTGAKAALFHPVTRQGRITGVLVVGFYQGREEVPEQELFLVELLAVGVFVALAIEAAQHQVAQRDYLDRIERLDRQKSDFLATVSHELRTPLTSISGYSEVLQEQGAGPLTVQQKRMLDAIGRNGDRLRSLIEDVMVLSRIEGGISEAAFVEVPIRELFGRVNKKLSAFAQRNTITLEIDTASPTATVLGDRTALDRAVVNIVSNAIKFSGPGGVVTVRGTLDQDARRVLITCQDHGVGIPAEDLADLFTRFFRASNATDQATPGSGLGLSIAKQIVQDHHGELRLTSVEGEGTTVVMDLPMLGQEPSCAPQPQSSTDHAEG